MKAPDKAAVIPGGGAAAGAQPNGTAPAALAASAPPQGKASDPSGPSPAEREAVIGLFIAGRYADAAAAAQILTAKYARHAFGWKLLGAALDHLGRSAEALGPFRTAAALAPEDAEAHYNLGVVQNDLGQLAEAVASYRASLRLRPDHAPTLSNLAVSLRRLGRLADAGEALGRALQSVPGDPQLLVNLGAVQKEAGRLAEAEESFRRALAVAPRLAAAHSNLGNVLRDMNRYDEALASFRHALAIAPDDFETRSSLLFLLNYLPGPDPGERLAEARRFGGLAAARAGEKFAEWACPTDATRLRVGLVSGDFRDHPVAHFLEGVLAAIDASSVELIAYPTRAGEDAVTTRLRRSVAGWRPLYGKSDAAAAREIHADGVHVLVDLSGHTAYNRLPLFACKPAPVQASWLGYFATTGLVEMDYVIADPWAPDKAGEAFFVEALWRLPETRLCFTPPLGAAAPAALPAIANGCVTFGCFNNLAKLNDGVIALWSRVLAALPASRLLLKARQLGDAVARRGVLERFAAHGVGAERLLLEGAESRDRYLAAYGRIDIALDPFPYTGGATTVEALWMGVPVLTLSGNDMLSRQGGGLLMNAGLREWIAADAGDYLRRAVAHAGDLAALARLRATLRQQVAASPVFDAPRLARHLEAAWRGMWETWRARRAT